MTEAVIPPVVLRPHRSDPDAATPAMTTASPRTLPLPALAAPRSSGLVYGMAAMDARGRVADHALVTALGWTPGTRLTIRLADGLLICRPDTTGAVTVTPQLHFRLPAPLRHACDLRPGNRVLLAADPQHNLLILHSPAALDTVLAPRHTHALGGDPA